MPQYNGVWTLEAQAQAQSNQQWVTDPNFKNTTLLLQADGAANTAQNNLFLDTSSNQFAITRNGNTTQGSFSPFSQAPGYWSNYFDGTDDYLTVPYNIAFAPASSDFTVEAWVYFPNALGTNSAVIMGNVNQSTGNGDWVLFYRGSTSLRFEFACSSSGLVAGLQRSYFNIIPVAGTWYHIAGVKSGSTLSCYVNGVKGTDATLATVNNGSLGNYIGTGTDLTGDFSGYISNLRVVKGTAVYTANFTPQTTPLGATSGGQNPPTGTQTSLLTCQSNRFVDNGGLATPNTITPNGTPSVQAFGPFAPALQWTPDVVGGSGYFDGTTDYLTGTVTAVNNTTMTMELWVYNTAFDNTNGNHYMQVNNATNANYALTHDGTGKARYVSRNNSGGAIFDLISATNVLKLNQWQHVVGVRNASAASLYVDGVRVATVSSPTVSTTDGTVLYVSSNGGTGRIISGYLASTRIVSGTAIYDPTLTTLTVPTAPLTAVANTRVLLNYTNAGIYDGKMANNLETVADAQVSTSVVKYGSGSIKFDGTGDYLQAPASNLYDFGSGDFTVELWTKGNNSATTSGALLVGVVTSGGATNTNWALFKDAPTQGYVIFYASDGTTYQVNGIGGAATLNDGNWHHVAVTRANSVFRVFVDGIQTGTTATWTGAISSTARPLKVGYNGSAEYLNGYLDDVRITKGVARYIANFTPPQQALPRQ